MKPLSILTFLLLANGHSFGQVLTHYMMSNSGNNTLLISSVFNSNGSGPVIQDNSTVTLFIPNGLTTPIVGSNQGGSWAANIIDNAILVGLCGAAADNYYLVQISTAGQANLGSVVSGVPESLFSVSFSGSSSLPINAYDPIQVDLLSACVGAIGADNTASIDLDGNSGAAPSIGYSERPVIPSGVALPIELTQFAARPLNATDALLNWETASEINSSHFEIERSQNGHDWKFVGENRAAGHSQSALHYDFVDEKVHAADGPNHRYYYRLKMVDRDGSFEYSPVRQVGFDGGGTIVGEPFPNPVNRDLATVQLPISTESGGDITITAYDVQGRSLNFYNTYLEPDSQLVDIDLGQLAAGVYNLKITIGSDVFARKLVVQQ